MEWQPTFIARNCIICHDRVSWYDQLWIINFYFNVCFSLRSSFSFIYLICLFHSRGISLHSFLPFLWWNIADTPFFSPDNALVSCKLPPKGGKEKVKQIKGNVHFFTFSGAVSEKTFFIVLDNWSLYYTSEAQTNDPF